MTSHPDIHHEFEVLDPTTGTTTKTSHLTAQQIPTALPVLMENAGLTWTVLQETDNTPIADLPVNALLIVAIAGFYALTTQRADFRAEQTALVAALAVATHSVYDVAREVLDRWLSWQLEVSRLAAVPAGG